MKFKTITEGWTDKKSMAFYVITFCNDCEFLCHFDLPKHDSLWQKWIIWITGNPHRHYFYFHYLIWLFGSYFDHLHRWWSWRTSSLTAQALCWCLSTCCQICQKSFGIPSVLSPHPRSKVTWWCCWMEWLSATRTPSCTGWDCASDAFACPHCDPSCILHVLHVYLCAGSEACESSNQLDGSPEDRWLRSGQALFQWRRSSVQSPGGHQVIIY